MNAAPPDPRAVRLAAALRANLRRRKAAPPAPPDGPPAASTTPARLGDGATEG